MLKGNARTAAESPAHLLSAGRVSVWIAGHADLLAGLVQLRGMGLRADKAVREVLAIPEVHRFRCSWQLWQTLLENDGVDVEDLLGRFVGHEALTTTRVALWGGETP